MMLDEPIKIFNKRDKILEPINIGGIQVNEETLNKLNKTADRIILSEEMCPLEFELLLKMLKKMISTNLIKNPNNGVELLLSKEEILKRVLEFYKTIDIKYYSEALDFLLQLKKNKSLEILLGRKDTPSLEPISVKQRGYHGYDFIYDKTNIFIRTQLKQKEEMEVNNKNIFEIRDSMNIVHEIAHSFDLNKTEGLFSIFSNIHKTESKKIKEIDKKVKENNMVRDVFSETTAVTFETLYLQYLMEMTEYPKSAISSLVIRRFNDSLYNADECYDNLRIAKIKKENGRICNEDIELLMDEYDENWKIIEKRIARIIRKNGQINEMKKYAISGLFTPTLVLQYQQNGVNILKQYIEAIKNNSIDQLFDLLEIKRNQEGIDALFVNMKKQIEPYCNFHNKKNDIIER